VNHGRASAERAGPLEAGSLRARELEANPRLERHWLQNLNLDQGLTLESGRVDAALIVAGWQYLQQPEEVAA
jgi:hypothetical protein